MSALQVYIYELTSPSYQSKTENGFFFTGCGYRMLRMDPVSGERKRMIPTLRSLVLAGVVSYATVLYLTVMSVTGPQQTILCAPITQNKVVLGVAQQSMYTDIPYFIMVRLLRIALSRKLTLVFQGSKLLMSITFVHKLAFVYGITELHSTLVWYLVDL